MSVQYALWREQERQIARVHSRIGRIVMRFALETGLAEFGADDLRRYVAARSKAAPASPDRILRDLRAKGVLDYDVVSRSKALYRFTRLPSEAA